MPLLLLLLGDLDASLDIERRFPSPLELATFADGIGGVRLLLLNPLEVDGRSLGDSLRSGFGLKPIEDGGLPERRRRESDTLLARSSSSSSLAYERGYLLSGL